MVFPVVLSIELCVREEFELIKAAKKPEYKLQVHDQVRIPPVRLPKSPEVPLVSKKITTVTAGSSVI